MWAAGGIKNGEGLKPSPLQCCAASAVYDGYAVEVAFDDFEEARGDPASRAFPDDLPPVTGARPPDDTNRAAPRNAPDLFRVDRWQRAEFDRR